MAIRVVHLYTGDDRESHFTESAGEPTAAAATTVSFEESAPGSSLSWRLVDDQPWRRVYVGLA
jgi:hypothetical protein